MTHLNSSHANIVTIFVKYVIFNFKIVLWKISFINIIVVYKIFKKFIIQLVQYKKLQYLYFMLFVF